MTPRPVPVKVMQMIALLRPETPRRRKRLIEATTQLLEKERAGKVQCGFCGEPMMLTRGWKEYCSPKCQTAMAMRRMRQRRKA
jgi:hypothetical protein